MNFIEIFANVPAGYSIPSSVLGCDLTYANSVEDDLFFDTPDGDRICVHKSGQLYVCDMERYINVQVLDLPEGYANWDAFKESFRPALPIDTPVMMKQEHRNFIYLAYWAGDGKVFKNGKKSTETQETMSVTEWCVPFTLFNVNDIEGSVAEHNILD